MAIAPQTTPYDSYRICESWSLLFVPGVSTNRFDLSLDQLVSHQYNHREQSEKYRRRSSNRQIVPLALGFYSHMRPRFFECHFHPPASHEPAQNLHRRMIEIGRQQRLRLKLTQRITNQHPTDRDWHISAAVPDGGLGIDFDHTLLPAVPMIDLDLRPLRFRFVEHQLWGRSSRAFHTWASSLPGFSFRGWVVKLGVESQPRDHVYACCAADKIKQIQNGEAAIAKEDNLPIRQPSSDQLDDLPSAIGQPLMTALLLLVIALGGAQNRKERQSPNATRPRNLDQKHRTKPAESARLDEMRLRRANRITIDSFSLDLLSAAAFDRIVEADDQFTTRCKCLDQHLQQHMREPERRPSRTIEHSMIVLEALVLAIARHTKTCRDSAFANGQNGSDQQGFRALPNQFGEKRRKLYNQWQQLGRQCGHMKDSFWQEIFRSLYGLPLIFQRPGMDKVQLKEGLKSLLY